jgi:hypothetical protein
MHDAAEAEEGGARSLRGAHLRSRISHGENDFIRPFGLAIGFQNFPILCVLVINGKRDTKQESTS